MRTLFSVLILALCPSSVALAKTTGGSSGPVVDIDLESCALTCKAPTFYVANHRFATFDPFARGTEGDPFHSIQDAIDAAEWQGACGVIIRLGEGYHTEPVDVRLPTRIEGYPVRLDGEPGPSAPTGLDGQFQALLQAGVVNKRGHALSVDHVSIVGADDHGIRQSGGGLCLTDVLVSGTRRTQPLGISGRGVALTGGASARMRRVALRDNDMGALDLAGFGTEAVVSHIQVFENRSSPTTVQDPEADVETQLAQYVARDREAAAVSVTDAATLWMEHFDLAENQGNGLLVAGTGGAHVRDGVARQHEDVGGVSGKAFAAIFGATLVGWRFEAYENTVGLQFVEAVATLGDVRSHHNSIGINLVRQDLSCMFNVIVRDNDRDSDSLDQEIPSAGDVLDGVLDEEPTTEEGSTELDCATLPWPR